MGNVCIWDKIKKVERHGSLVFPLFLLFNLSGPPPPQQQIHGCFCIAQRLLYIYPSPCVYVDVHMFIIPPFKFHVSIL